MPDSLTPHPSPAPSRRDTDTLGIPRIAPASSASRAQRLIDGLKTFLWVAPLTLLIWIYAERSQHEDVDVPIGLQVRSASANRVLNIKDPITRRVEISLRGPRAGLDAVRDELSKDLDLVIEDQYAPGQDYSFQLAERIGKKDTFVKHGVTVERASPTSMIVNIQARETLRVPVKVHPDIRHTGPAPQFDPPYVDVSGPPNDLKRLEVAAGVYADIAAIIARPPGTYGPEDVSVAPKTGRSEHISISPPEVKATLTIQPSAPKSLQAVPIELGLPNTLFGADQLIHRWKITFRPWPTISDVLVIGPSDVVEKLVEKREFAPKVYIPLTTAELAPGDHSIELKQHHFLLPPGVTVTNNPPLKVIITVAENQ